jgi:hypothetical protein
MNEYLVQRSNNPYQQQQAFQLVAVPQQQQTRGPQPALAPAAAATTAGVVTLQQQQQLLRVMATHQIQAGVHNAVLTAAALQQQLLVRHHAALQSPLGTVLPTAGMPMAAAAGGQTPLVRGMTQQQGIPFGMADQHIQ